MDLEEFIWEHSPFMNAEQIVRALAATSPLDYDSGECVFCNRLGRYVVPHASTTADHVPACPWRLAREWVAAQG